MERETEACVVWKERDVVDKTYEYFGLDAGQPLYKEKLIHQISKFPYCSSCGKRIDDRFMHFCPNCGAKFKEEVKKHE